LLMEHGTTLQICEKYSDSTKVFTQAEDLADSVDYTSVSEIATSTLTSEGMKTYKGDTFEKLFLNASKALNFLQEKNTDSALVEVRRMNQKFTKLKNEERKNFELNSFSKYLSGLIWESTGQFDDACIDYKDAYFTATQFRDVGVQMLATCWNAQRVDEFNTLVKKINATTEEIQVAKSSKAKSEIVLVYLQGWGPQKLENPSAPTFPYLADVSNNTQKLTIDLYEKGKDKSNKSFLSDTIYSVADASRSSLNADQASLIARRLASRVAKHVVAKQIGDKDPLLGFVALIGMVASDRADLRQWSFLPNTIQIIRIPVTPGQYSLKIGGIGRDKQQTEIFRDVNLNVDKHQKIIHMIRSVL
ncbi:MAG: hypothetical protein H7235_11320, partial [Bdellovibrionaceae bacterium]|nr:hypothetical protein [Pseudobdellovibrionaceae bacterium]